MTNMHAIQPSPAEALHEVSVLRLDLLWGLYMAIVVGLGIVVWPGVIHRTPHGN